MARRHNHKGRSKSEGAYFALPYSMARHDAWRGLSGAAIKLYIELRCRYTVRGDGSNNNGELRVSLDEAARLLSMGKATVSRAYKELEAAGFIAKVKQGQWYGRKATEWRVTDQSYGGQFPSRDWRIPAAEKQKSVSRPTMYSADGSILKPRE